MTFTAPITQFGEDAYAYLEPLWADDDQRGYPFKTLVAGLCEAFREGEEVVRARPGRDPYQQAWDVEACPDRLLRFLGQALGINVTPGVSPDVQRQQIRAEQNWYRGSVQNLIAAAEANQTEPGRTVVEERTPDAGTISVIYDPAYTPDVTAYTNAVRAAVRWGLRLVLTASSVPLFDEGTVTFDSVSSSITFDAATLADIT